MGDDLGSDDELWMKQNVVDSDDDDDASSQASPSPVKEGKVRKRKISEDESGEKPKKEKSKKKKLSPEKLLLEAARDLESQDAKHQAAFLNSALSHYQLLSSSGNEKLPDMLKLTSENFMTSSKETLFARLNDAISLKKMKTWKHVGSPCVIIVCISARRAVAVLKEISSLKVRAAKLFPKNGSVEEQCKQLSSSAFGVAVGTPHRLHALCQQGKDGLSLNRTQLLVLDSDVSNKQFTVCTLPDTAPHCMEFVREFCLPEIKKRKEFRLAFF